VSGAGQAAAKMVDGGSTRLPTVFAEKASPDLTGPRFRIQAWCKWRCARSHRRSARPRGAAVGHSPVIQAATQALLVVASAV